MKMKQHQEYSRLTDAPAGCTMPHVYWHMSQFCGCDQYSYLQVSTICLLGPAGREEANRVMYHLLKKKVHPLAKGAGAINFNMFPYISIHVFPSPYISILFRTSSIVSFIFLHVHSFHTRALLALNFTIMYLRQQLSRDQWRLNLCRSSYYPPTIYRVTTGSRLP